MQEEVKNPLIEVSPKQWDFIKNSNHSWNLASGVTRSGKTHAQAMRFIDFMYNEAKPKTLHLISGRTMEALTDNFLRIIKSMDSINDIEIRGNPKKLYIKSRQIECRCIGCDNELATNRIQGLTVSSWWADEIVKHPKSFVDMAVSRCSAGGIQAPKFWTCNPDSPTHFIKTDYMDNPNIDIKNWYFGFPDNPVLSDSLVNELKNTFTGAFYDRMILGLWTVAEGCVYDRFSMSEHVKDEAPKNIERYILGIDWGYSEALAMTLYGIEPDGTWWQVDEYQEQGKLIDSGLIAELEAKGWFDLPIYSGGVIAGRTKPEVAYADSNRPEYIQLFGDMTKIDTIPAIKRDKPELIQAVQLKYNKGLTDKYGIYYLSKCKKTLAQKMSYRWKGNGKDEVIKKDDHLMDSEQYAIFMSGFGGSVYIPEGYANGVTGRKRLVSYGS
jgi:PBSX family phage terminase large subunit